MIEKASRSTLESLPAQNKAFWHFHPSSPENFPVLRRFSKILSPKKRHKSGTPLIVLGNMFTAKNGSSLGAECVSGCREKARGENRMDRGSESCVLKSG
jgi:hypothetical protein